MERELDRTQRLLGEARAGRREALEELLGRHRREIERGLDAKLPARLRPRVDVSDVVQDALLDAYRHLDAFEPRGVGSFRGWLRKIAENRLRMAIEKHLASAQREAAAEVPFGAPGADPSAGSTSPSVAADRAERRTVLRTAMAELSVDHRRVLELVRLQGLSIAQAALAMERSENAIKKLMARALVELSGKLPRGMQP